MKKSHTYKCKRIESCYATISKNKNESSKEETHQTYDFARVRIHIEGIMQILRVYQISTKT